MLCRIIYLFQALHGHAYNINRVVGLFTVILNTKEKKFITLWGRNKILFKIIEIYLIKVSTALIIVM